MSSCLPADSGWSNCRIWWLCSLLFFFFVLGSWSCGNILHCVIVGLTSWPVHGIVVVVVAGRCWSYNIFSWSHVCRTIYNSHRRRFLTICETANKNTTTTNKKEVTTIKTKTTTTTTNKKAKIHYSINKRTILCVNAFARTSSLRSAYAASASALLLLTGRSVGRQCVWILPTTNKFWTLQWPAMFDRT